MIRCPIRRGLAQHCHDDYENPRAVHNASVVRPEPFFYQTCARREGLMYRVFAQVLHDCDLVWRVSLWGLLLAFAVVFYCRAPNPKVNVFLDRAPARS